MKRTQKRPAASGELSRDEVFRVGMGRFYSNQKPPHSLK